jgi:site-specific recombinase XerD|nr:MAG TPA: Integrase [Caudoviricetes sp.]
MAQLSFVIVPSRANTDGTHTIRLKITNVNTTRYILTKYKVGSEKQFQNGKVVKHPQATAINQKLHVMLGEYEILLSKLCNPRATATEIKNFLEQPRFVGENLRKYAEKYIDELKSNGQDSYAQNMGYTLKYLTECFGENVAMSSLNTNAIKMWEKWLAKMGYSPTTINIRMSHLKALLNAAVTEGIVEYKVFPFRGYKMPTKDVREIWITKDELRKLRKAEFTGVSARRHTVARDLFMLSFYFAGINLTDLMDARLDGETITFVRKKTAAKKHGEKEVSLTIQPEARAIIDKYITTEGKLDFGYNYSQYEQFRSFVTKGLNKIGQDLEFEKRLMFYSARKTFVQFGQQLGIPLYVLEYAIGQSVKDANNRPIFDYMKVMRFQADLAIRKIIDFSFSDTPEAEMPVPEWAK